MSDLGDIREADFGVIHMDLTTKALTPGCCADKSCKPATCMKLLAGETCGSCIHLDRCATLFGANQTNTICDFYPRRFYAAPGS